MKYFLYLCIMKQCSKCKEIKEFEFFNKSSSHSTGYKSQCKICRNNYNQIYIKKGLTEKQKLNMKEYKKIWKENNRDKVRESRRLYKQNKKATDPLFKMKENLRRRTLKAFKTKGWVKSGGTEILLQGTYDEVFNHIEGLFTEGMTWDNQGQWHIDHIIPLSSANTPEDIIQLFDYKNLQPLWAIDNILKSNK